MTVHILDPNVISDGPHLAYSLALAREAKRREQRVIIYSSAAFPRAKIEDVEFVRLFETPDHAATTDEVGYRYDCFVRGSDTIYDNLRSIAADTIMPRDVVIVTSMSESDLLGFISWMKSFDIRQAPLFVVYLASPATPEESGKTPGDPISALFYSLVFKAASTKGPPIFFLAGTPESAKEFSALAKHPIDAHPSPQSDSSASSAKSLFDNFGALWAKRIAASHGDLWSRTISLNLSTDLDKGWHQPGRLRDRVVRWTKQEPSFSFHWTKGLPWTARLEVEIVPSGDMLRQARLTINGEPRPFDCVFRSAHKAAIHIDSNGIERAFSKFDISLRLPFTHSPQGDARQLGIMISEITIAQSSTPDAPVTKPLVQTPLASDGLGGFFLIGTTSGHAPAGLNRCTLCFMIVCGNPDRVRGMNLFVNGNRLRFNAALIAEEQWACTADVPDSLLAKGGFVLDWDLVTDFTAADKVRLTDLEVVTDADDYVWRQIKARVPSRNILLSEDGGTGPDIVDVLPVGKIVRFGKTGTEMTLLRNGWHPPEGDSSWMADLQASMKLALDRDIDDGVIVLEALAMGTRERPVTATFLLSGEEIGRATWFEPTRRTVELRPKDRRIPGRRPLSLEIRVDRQSTDDNRSLGLRLFSLVAQEDSKALRVLPMGVRTRLWKYRHRQMP